MTESLAIEPVRKAPKWLGLKRVMSSFMCTDLVGRLLGTFYHEDIPYAGLKIRTNGPAIAGRTRAMLFWGQYESAELRFVKKYLDPKLDTVELGASIGGISSHVAAKLAPSQQLIVVEANPELLPLLNHNLQRHGQHLRVSVISGAIAYAGDSVQFSVAADSLESKVGNDPGSTGVPAVKLKSLIPPGPYQMVCDIEGAEYEILTNDSEALRHCQQIIIELHTVSTSQAPITIGALNGMIKQQGFRLRDTYGNVFVYTKGPL